VVQLQDDVAACAREGFKDQTTLQVFHDFFKEKMMGDRYYIYPLLPVSTEHSSI